MAFNPEVQSKKESLGLHDDEEDRLEREIGRRENNGAEPDNKELLGLRDDEEARLEKESGHRGNKEVEQDSKEFLGLRNNEEERLDKENKRREISDKDREAQGRMDKLRAELDGSRAEYAKYHYQSKNQWARLKSFFGSVSVGQDRDLETMRGIYQKSLMDYRNAQMSNIDALPEAEKRKAMLDMKIFDIKEHISLYKDRVDAKAEKFPTVGKVAMKAVDWYRKLNPKTKLVLSGALLAGGMVSGVGAAAGIFGGLALAKRMLGAGAAGVGATGFMEARAQKKEHAQLNASIEAFRGLTPEEQKGQLASFDNASFMQLEKSFHGKVAGRERRVMAGIGVTAGVMALGFAGKMFGAHHDMVQGTAGQQIVDNKIQPLNIGHTASSGVDHTSPQGMNPDYIKDQLAKQDKIWMEVEQKNSYMHNIAQKMGIDDSNKLEYHRGADGALYINNAKVPDNILSADERSLTHTISDMNGIENGNKPGNFDGEKVRNALKHASKLRSSNDIHMSETGGIVNHNIDQSIVNTAHEQLTVNTGSSVEGTLMKYLEAHHDKLTEGKMGWDPNKYKNIHEWAGKRAHVLAQEFAKTHKGLDIDRYVQPGTKLDLDLSNPADVKLNVNFEGGPHIVPDHEKIMHAVNSRQETNIGGNVPSEKIMENINYQKDIMNAFQLNKEGFSFYDKHPASEALKAARQTPAHVRSLIDNFLINLDKRDVNFGNRTVTDVLKEALANSKG